MMEGWIQERIGDISIVGDGAHASIKREKDGILYLTSKNFDAEGIKLDKVDYISSENYNRYFKANSKALTKPIQNDILLSIIGTIGAPYLIKKTDVFGLSSSVSILRPNQEKILPQYLVYWIKGEYFQGSINNIKSGVAQSFLSLEMIRSLPCYYPPLPTQRKIAKILSAYDDLIENNLKRIKLLEEMAQITYEEWFVRMKFPGHETAVFDKETGLPEGWRKDISDHIFNIKIGKTPPRGETHWFNTNESLKWVSIKDMRNSNLYLFETKETIDNKAIIKFNFNIAKQGTVILSFKLTVGLVSILNDNMVTNEAIAHFNSDTKNTLSNEYTYLYLNNFNYDQMGSTSSIGTAINSKIVKRIPFLIPSNNVLEMFDKVIKPSFKSIKNLQIQNQRLKEARDILLPRLMTGMIEVEKLELN